MPGGHASLCPPYATDLTHSANDPVMVSKYLMYHDRSWVPSSLVAGHFGKTAKRNTAKNLNKFNAE
jgi:hypothetical protein